MALFSDTTYKILADSSRAMNTDPRDFLVVFASESGLNPASTRGLPYRGFNTMSRDAAAAVGILPEFWDMLPDLPIEDNMRASMQFFTENLKRYGRSSFTSALDIYLFNFSPATWRTNAGPDTNIYTADRDGDAYYQNATMDNFPALTSFASQHGLPFNNLSDMKSAAQQAVAAGVLKGKITVADLRSFVLRPDVKAIWKPHVDRLTALGLAPSSSGGGVASADTGESLWSSVAYTQPGAYQDDYNPDVPSWQDWATQRNAQGTLPPAESPEQGLKKASTWGWIAGAAGVGLLVRWLLK